MSASNALETMLLQWSLTAGSPTRPTTWFLSLHTGDPGETGASNELSGNGYARQSIAFTVSGDTATSSTSQSFGPNSGSNWGTVTHFAIWTASSGGTCLYVGAWSGGVAYAVGDTATVAAGQVTVTAD